MEKNVDTILGIETTVPQKPNTIPPFPQQVVNQPTAAEKIANILAIIILVIGGLATLGFLIGAFTHPYEKESFLLIVIGVALSTLLIWSILKLFVQNAKTLREINSKLK